MTENAFVSFDEGVRKSEKADLFDHILVCHKAFVIVELTSVFGATADIIKHLAPVNKGNDSRRNRNERNRHRSKAGCFYAHTCNMYFARNSGKNDDERNHADHGGDAGTRSRKHLHRPVARLARGIFQLFIEIGTVKTRDIDRLCLFHYFDVRPVCNKLACNPRCVCFQA